MNSAVYFFGIFTSSAPPRDAGQESTKPTAVPFIAEELGAIRIRPDRKDETPRFGKLGGIRQWTKSVFDTFKGQLGLERYGGRTLAGVCARAGAKLLALALVAETWHN